MLLRRRMYGVGKKVDPYPKYVKLKTCNTADSSKPNILGNNFNKIWFVEDMIIDGVSVTPTKSYIFEDSNYHDVFVKFHDTTTIPDSAFMLAQSAIMVIDIPECYTNFGGNAIRSIGAYGREDVIIRSTTYPTFGNYNNYGHSGGHLWVPDNLYDDYLTSPVGFNTNNIHKLSDWTG